jgi:hypothetical protein
MQNQNSFIFAFAGIFLVLLLASLSANPTRVTASDFTVDGEDWPGFWFTCEFANRQRPPDDGCRMFDDEGFQLAEGRLRYIRITESDEIRCRGQKKGQCFAADRPEITITRSDRGKLSLGKNQFKVRYFGCTQIYYFADRADYREIWPDQKRCFWASKRRFYIAPYKGKVTIAD